MFKQLLTNAVNEPASEGDEEKKWKENSVLRTWESMHKNETCFCLTSAIFQSSSCTFSAWLE